MTPLVNLLALALVLAVGSPAMAASAGQAVARGAARALAGKEALRGALTSQTAKAGASRALTAAERRAYARLLRELDQATLSGIERRFGEHILASRGHPARQTPTGFLSHEPYQARLTAVYPQLSAAQRQKILGDFRNRPFVDRSNPLLPRTVAHERLHELADPRFRATLGSRLDEGATAHLASKISNDLGIQHLTRPYVAERRIVEMIEARVGERALARAYFRGEIEPLRQAVDAQLGRGALDSVARLTVKGRFLAAEEILKHGLRSRSHIGG